MVYIKNKAGQKINTKVAVQVSLYVLLFSANMIDSVGLVVKLTLWPFLKIYTDQA